MRKKRFEKELRLLTCPVGCPRASSGFSLQNIINKNGKLSRTHSSNITTSHHGIENTDHFLDRHLLLAHSALSCCSPGHPSLNSRGQTPSDSTFSSTQTTDNLIDVTTSTTNNTNNSDNGVGKSNTNVMSPIVICNPNDLMSNRNQRSSDFQCISLTIIPELGERIMISGKRSIIEEIFSEISSILMDGRTNITWNQDSKHIFRFPLNGYCKFNSLQTISRLLNHNFRIIASNGGGSEGQQYNEYLFTRNQVRLD